VAVNRNLLARSGKSQAQGIRRLDRFLARRKDRKKEPITQGVRALGPSVGLKEPRGRGETAPEFFCLIRLSVF
jgi:hypothetical protein